MTDSFDEDILSLISDNTEESQEQKKRKLIKELKKEGTEKPDSVSWGNWIGPEKHNHRHDFIVHLAAAGASQKEIAQEVGMTQARVSVIMSQPDIKEKIRAKQEKFWGTNAQKRFENLLPKAIDVAAGILQNEQSKDQLRAQVAFQLMDRALGKPIQKTEVQGNLLSELLLQLDQKDRDALPINPNVDSEENLDENKDPVDTFLDAHIPELTVGERVYDENSDEE